MSPNCSMPAFPATSAARFTERGGRSAAARRGRPARRGAIIAIFLAGCPYGIALGQAGEARAAAGPGASTPFYANSFERAPSAAAMTALGRVMFFDRSLSAGGKMACATCHDPARAYAPANDLPVQRGGPDNRRPGVRAVMSLTYTQNIPPFTEHYFEDEGDDSIDQGPAGGRTWDGRAQSAHDQARLPLLSPYEMANASPEEVVAKVRRAAYAPQFRETFGETVFADGALAFKGVLMALESFQQSPAEFYPYSSKYDAFLRRETFVDPRRTSGHGRVQRSGQGQLRALPSERRSQWCVSAIHGFWLRRRRGAAQHGDPRQRGSALPRPRVMRTAAHRSCRPRGILRPVPHAFPAQRGAAARFLS